MHVDKISIFECCHNPKCCSCRFCDFSFFGCIFVLKRLGLIRDGRGTTSVRSCYLNYSFYTQANIETASNATLGLFLRDGIKRIIMGFPYTTRSHLELNWTEQNSTAQHRKEQNRTENRIEQNITEQIAYCRLTAPPTAQGQLSQCFYKTCTLHKYKISKHNQKVSPFAVALIKMANKVWRWWYHWPFRSGVSIPD